ncbi:hypothetical protein E6H34_09245 [Candidatus Bathyarchaeota archaeon]|nr:MAG: hypothetical protein E6H34_09245 [Candidatus Bathyarchaeota archaeon]
MDTPSPRDHSSPSKSFYAVQWVVRGRCRLEPSRKPLNLLVRKLQADVSVRLKNDAEYRGKMIDCDSHMNIILDGAREYRGGDPSTNFGSLIVRGSNVLYVCVSEPTP